MANMSQVLQQLLVVTDIDIYKKMGDILRGLYVTEFDAESVGISDKYWLHINADTAFSGDDRIRDKSLNLNDFVFGDDLSSAAALADARFITTIDPQVSPDGVLRAPSLNYDYANGESILIYFKGKISAPTELRGRQIFMGDTFLSSQGGISFRMRPVEGGSPAGLIDFFLRDADTAAGTFAGPSSTSVGDGLTHSFALYLDGQLRAYKWYVDGVPDSALVNFGAQLPVNTASSATFNVGAGSAYPGGSAGLATSTNTLAILRSPTSLDIQRVDDAVAQLHIDGTKLVSNSL